MFSKFFSVLVLLVLLFLNVSAVPSGVSISVAGNLPYATSATPALTIAATDANGMKFSCDNSTWSAIEVFSTSKSNFDITIGNGCVSGDGNKTVYVMFEATDASTATASDGIYLDSTKPVATVSGNSSSWSTIDLNLSFSCSDAASGCQKITVDGNDYSGSSANVAFSSDGEKTVAYYSTDVAGNIEAQQSVSVKIDKTFPSGTIAVSGTYINSKTPKFILSASDSHSGMSSGKMKFSCGSSYSSEITYAVDYGSFDITSGNDCNSSQGGKTIHVKFADAVGNWTATDINTQLIFDSVAPNVPTISTAVAGNGQVVVNWNAVTDNGASGIKDYNVYYNDTFAGTTTSTSYTVSGLTNGTSYSFQVSARDNAGNGSAKSVSVSVAPVAPSDSSSSSSGSSSGSSGSDSGSGSGSTSSADNSFPEILWIELDENKNLAGVQKIKVKATDSSGVLFVSLYVDSEEEKNLVGKIETKSGEYYEFDLNTLNWVSGIHSLIAVSLDNSINQNKASVKLPVKFNFVEEKKEQKVEKSKVEAKLFYSVSSPFLKNETKALIKVLGLDGQIEKETLEIFESAKPKRKIEITKSGRKFNLTVKISFKAGDANSLKLVEIVPKELSETAEGIDSAIPFKILVGDPVIEFDLNDLDSNKTIEIEYRLKKALDENSAKNLSKSNIAAKFSVSPILLPYAAKIDYRAFGKKSETKDFLTGLFDFGKIPVGALILGFAIVIAGSLLFLFSRKIPLLPKPKTGSSAVVNDSSSRAANVSTAGVSADSTAAVSADAAIVSESENVLKRKTLRDKIIELDKLEEKVKGLRKE